MTLLADAGITWKDASDVLMAVFAPTVAVVSGLVGWLWKRLGRVEKAHADCEEKNLHLTLQNADQERRLKSTETKLGKVVEHVVRIDNLMRNSCVIQTDADGNVMVWDDKAVRMFGWTNGEMLGKPLGGTERSPGIFPLQYSEQFMDVLRLQGQAKVMVRDHREEIDAVCKRGERFTVRVLINTWLANGKWYWAGEFTRAVAGLVQQEVDGINTTDWTKSDSDPFKQGPKTTSRPAPPPPTPN